MNLEMAGAKTFALGLLLLGAVSAASGQFVPGLQPVDTSSEAVRAVARVNGFFLIAVSAALFIERFRKQAAILFAIYMAAWLLAAHVPQLLLEPFEITRMVSIMEVAAIVATLQILAFAQNERSIAAAKVGSIVYGCMLLLFAGVHFQYHAFIASMIPSWVPFAALWPWFTASANLVAGLSFLIGKKAQLAGALLGAMYASWVPIVHLPRVVSAPGSVEEWTAGALAVTLAGAAWMVAGSGQGRGFDPVASLASTVRNFVRQMSEREAAG